MNLSPPVNLRNLSPPVNLRNLSSANLAKVCEINARLHEVDPAGGFPLHLYNLLKPSISNIHFCTGLYELDPFAINQHENPTIDPKWNAVVEQHAFEHPFVQILLDDPSTHLAVTPNGVFQSTTLYNEVYTKLQAQHQMWVGIKDGNQILNCIYSREKAYDEAAISMLHLILPHIGLSWNIWKRTAGLKKEIDHLTNARFESPEQEAQAAQTRKKLDGLTARQRDVVELVADGKDNQQIADELKISVLTVKKHLQTIFQSLEVQHRTQLAAQWHKAHSVKLY